MNGPRIVCAGCGVPVKGIGPFCDNCMGAQSGPPVERCELCEQGYAKDLWGCHTTARGGFVGKCRLPPSITGRPSSSGSEG